jgi:hypothetical protein
MALFPKEEPEKLVVSMEASQPVHETVKAEVPVADALPLEAPSLENGAASPRYLSPRIRSTIKRRPS